jgi:hypothetical protein
MSVDPISRVDLARREIDRILGDGYASAHPDVLAAVITSATADFATIHITRALQDIAAALIDPEDDSSHIMRTMKQPLVRP